MKLEPEIVKVFEGKYVKLEYNNGFNLRGAILKVSSDSIIFETTQAKSVIPISEIKSIVEQRGW